MVECKINIVSQYAILISVQEEKWRETLALSKKFGRDWKVFLLGTVFLQMF